MRSLLKPDEELGHRLGEARSLVVGHDVDAGAVNKQCSGLCLLCEELTYEMIRMKLTAVKQC